MTTISNDKYVSVMTDYQLLPPVYHDATNTLKHIQGVEKLEFRSMEYLKSGVLGIDIVINSVTVFFSNTNALEITRIPEGSSHAVEYVNQILKPIDNQTLFQNGKTKM